MSSKESGELSSVGELVRDIIKAMVDHPSEVMITEVAGQHSYVLEVGVHREDVCKIIGKKGVHAQAIRTITTAAGGKLHRRYVVVILEDC